MNLLGPASYFVISMENCDVDFQFAYKKLKDQFRIDSQFLIQIDYEQIRHLNEASFRLYVERLFVEKLNSFNRLDFETFLLFQFDMAIDKFGLNRLLLEKIRCNDLQENQREWGQIFFHSYLQLKPILLIQERVQIIIEKLFELVKSDLMNSAPPYFQLNKSKLYYESKIQDIVIDRVDLERKLMLQAASYKFGYGIYYITLMRIEGMIYFFQVLENMGIKLEDHENMDWLVYLRNDFSKNYDRLRDVVQKERD